MHVCTRQCDVIWRLYRPIILGCDKPREKPWSESTSGSNPPPLDGMAVFEKPNGEATLYNVRQYLCAWARWRRSGGRGDAPRIADYKCDV
jgi:hypothetical protein